MKKPPGCHGCPFYQDGEGFVPDEYVEGATTLVMGQNPGADEEAGRKVTNLAWQGRRRVPTTEPHPPAPYLGTTGYDMERQYFPLAGLVRGENVSLANPIRCRWQGKNELPPVGTPLIRQVVEHCQQAHFRPPSSTKLIIAEGTHALYACTGEDGAGSPGHRVSMGIDGWRGWVLPYNPPPRPRLVHTDVFTAGSRSIVVLPTYHLAYLYRSPWLTPVSQKDWSKVPAILKGTWPEPLPRTHAHTPGVWPVRCAFDTEFSPGGLTRYSVAWRGLVPGDDHLHVVEAGAHTVPVVVPGRLTVGFHNVEADVAYLNQLLGHHRVILDTEDTMYLHAVLHADLDHDLDFVGSMYARTNRWKHLFRTNPRVYAGCDALGTWDAMVSLLAELERDPQVRKVYYDYQLPLAGIIHKARGKGLRVVPERVAQALAAMDTRQADAEARAQACVGWPLNLGSPQQVAQQLYEVEQVQVNPISGRMRR